MRLVVSLAVATCAAFAAPIDNADMHLINQTPSDNAPLCGYVRMEETAWWSVGLQTHGICEPIWNNETAVIYRIDRERCGCAFFV
ncbi:hypothetical protein BU23DRAFT_558383 [Bimuria novae-zelandiae CBS 107.79]|uniref:Uncharacterized protein n=1 Tax=Bimuria novae-zelandiae CBS 107.79 TaxID=1447943 RepID=A0A6A5UUJ5_9PLEO|nr:hypothetical protein BU23DRAFT_558383 [Bimuria novae-zelandiae CBS 107.79]